MYSRQHHMKEKTGLLTEPMRFKVGKNKVHMHVIIKI